mmetsp:Transcript_25497/g.37811  ORF Transcript_25497/g.37811 Transcript_25497/m.37811 type:complete len:426 (+) Transcript_25497:125-1402(+)
MFSWSGGNKEHRRSGSTSQYTRQMHISSYLTDPILKPSTRKINDSTYDTVFQTKDHNALILRVHIPPSISISAPRMTLVGVRAVHPWIDSKMKVIGYSNIKSDAIFVQSGLILSKVVNEVVQHFQLNPPKQLVIVDAGLKRLQDSLTGNANANNNAANQNVNSSANHYNQGNGASNGHAQGYGNGNRYGHGYGQAPSSQPPAPTPVNEPPKLEPYKLPPHFTQIITLSTNEQQQQLATLKNLELPNAPTYFPEFDSLDRNTMANMIDDPSQLLMVSASTNTSTSTSFNLSKQSIVQEMEELKFTLMEANSTVAEEHLNSEPTLVSLQNEVKHLQSSLKDKVELVNELQRRQMELCKPMKMDKIVHKLKKAKKKIFDESEELAYDWLQESGGEDGGAEVISFLDKFLEVRTVHHVRAAKLERLQQS